MVYTGGLIKDINKMETLEELQDNKMTMVCDKLDLKKGDRLLDIGCGWGTLVTHAAKNYGADVTGGTSLYASLQIFLRTCLRTFLHAFYSRIVTLAREQAAFGSKRLQENNIPESQGRILCHDFRDVPNRSGYYNKISCLEMAEHVGIRRYSTFLKDVYNLLADDGIMVFQVAGIRTCWQYEDLNWGLL
jgi:cyclopropane fatty-acyl-phospholipid synthase-like methyltransferase